MSDFFDDDLERVRRRDSSPGLDLGPGGKSVEETGRFEGPQEGGDLNLTQMTRHKEQVEDQVATAMKELERLRQRQEDLQHQKSDLEELRKKQQLFDTGKRDLLDQINQGLIGLEKDELRAEQLVDLLSTTRKQLKNWAKELDQLNEQNWDQDKYRTELNSAISVIEDARADYNRSRVKIETMRSSFSETGAPTAVPEGALPVQTSASLGLMSFMTALKVGIAFTLPLTLALLLVLLVHYLLTIGVL